MKFLLKKLKTINYEKNKMRFYSIRYIVFKLNYYTISPYLKFNENNFKQGLFIVPQITKMSIKKI